MNQTNFVGVDTHKESLAYYVDGKFKEFKTTQKDFESAPKENRKDLPVNTLLES